MITPLSSMMLRSARTAAEPLLLLCAPLQIFSASAS
jgi:hypothetical protein